MCRAALESPRKSIIFEPYPSVVDPNDPKTLAFNPKVSILTTGIMLTYWITACISFKLAFFFAKQNIYPIKIIAAVAIHKLKTWDYMIVITITVFFCKMDRWPRILSKTLISTSDFRYLYVVPSLIAYQWMSGSTNEHRRRIMRDCRKHWIASCPFGKWPRYKEEVGGTKGRGHRKRIKATANICGQFIFKVFSLCNAFILCPESVGYTVLY